MHFCTSFDNEELEKRLLKGLCAELKCWNQYPKGTAEREAAYVDNSELEFFRQALKEATKNEEFYPYRYTISDNIADKVKSAYWPATQNGLKVVGGALAIAGGAAECYASVGIGCAFGASAAVYGAGSIESGVKGWKNQYNENGVDGHNFVKSGFMTFSPENGELYFMGSALLVSLGAGVTATAPANMQTYGSMGSRAIFTKQRVSKLNNPIVLPLTNTALPVGAAKGSFIINSSVGAKTIFTEYFENKAKNNGKK